MNPLLAFAISNEQFSLLILLSVFFGFALWGFGYDAGKKKQRELEREYAEKRARDLTQAGYDPTPVFKKIEE